MPIAVLGLRELPAQPVQLGLLVAGHADHRRRAGGVGEPVAGLPHLVHGLLPRAVELHEFGAMHQTLTAEGHQIRLRITPAGQRRGPLLRPPQIEDLLARRDHTAIGDPGNRRGHLTGGDRDHDLVEQRDTLGRLCQPDQRLAPAEPGQRLQVGVAETPADLGGPAEGGARGRGIAARHALQRGWQKQIPLLDAVQMAVVKQPPGPGEPATTTGELTQVQKCEAQPERAPNGTRHITKAQPFVIRPRQDVGTVVVPAGQISGQPKPFKILRRKRGLMIRSRQSGIGIRPSPPAKGASAPIERIGRGHTLPPPQEPRRELPVHNPAYYATHRSGSTQVLTSGITWISLSSPIMLPSCFDTVEGCAHSHRRRMTPRSLSMHGRSQKRRARSAVPGRLEAPSDQREARNPVGAVADRRPPQ